MNWKLLSRGLGTVWLCACGVVAYLIYAEHIATGNGGANGWMVAAIPGVFGFAVALVIAAACPAAKAEGQRKK